MPAHSHASLLFSYPPSEMAPAGTSAAIVPVVDHSSVGSSYRLWLPHLTGFLPPSSAPQSPPVVPPTIVATTPSLPPNDLMEDFLYHFTSGSTSYLIAVSL